MCGVFVGRGGTVNVGLGSWLGVNVESSCGVLVGSVLSFDGLGKSSFGRPSCAASMYAFHSRAARLIAEESFGADRVLGRLCREADL